MKQIAMRKRSSGRESSCLENESQYQELLPALTLDFINPFRYFYFARLRLPVGIILKRPAGLAYVVVPVEFACKWFLKRDCSDRTDLGAPAAVHTFPLTVVDFRVA